MSRKGNTRGASLRLLPPAAPAAPLSHEDLSMNPQRSSVLPFPTPSSFPGQSPEGGGSSGPTLEGLVQRFGTVPHAQNLAFVGRAPVAALVDNGGRVAVERVRKDGVRLFAAAADFLAVATPEQRKLLQGVTDGFLAAGVGALQASDTVCGAVKGANTTKTRQRAQLKRRAKTTEDDVVTRREVLYAACLPLTGADPAWKQRLDEAWGSGPRTPESLAGSLEGLVSVARELTADATARGLTHALDAAYLDASLALATRLKDAHGDAAASTSAAQQNVTQGTAEWWRGACPWFIKALLDMFAAARRGDKRVPRLRASTLKTLYSRSSKRTWRAPQRPNNPPPVTPPNTRRAYNRVSAAASAGNARCTAPSTGPQ